MKVLAAMSGGVDSSVAAARMVDAGHEVVGVHLALSHAPGHYAPGRGLLLRRTPTMPAGSPTSSESRSTSGISPTGSKPTSSTTSSPPMSAVGPQPVRAVQ